MQGIWFSSTHSVLTHIFVKASRGPWAVPLLARKQKAGPPAQAARRPLRATSTTQIEMFVSGRNLGGQSGAEVAIQAGSSSLCNID